MTARKYSQIILQYFRKQTVKMSYRKSFIFHSKTLVSVS